MPGFYEVFYGLTSRLSKLDGYTEDDAEELYQLLQLYKGLLGRLTMLPASEQKALASLVTKIEPILAATSYAGTPFLEQKKNYLRSRNLLRLTLRKTVMCYSRSTMHISDQGKRL